MLTLLGVCVTNELCSCVQLLHDTLQSVWFVGFPTTEERDRAFKHYDNAVIQGRRLRLRKETHHVTYQPLYVVHSSIGFFSFWFLFVGDC